MLGRRGSGKPHIGMLDLLFAKKTYGAMKRRGEDRSHGQDGHQGPGPAGNVRILDDETTYTTDRKRWQ